MREILFEYTFPNQKRLLLLRGDLTKEPVDAIVNAANEHLAHGGGVAGAISHAGGPLIQEQSNRLAPVATGDAVRTEAGDLPCNAVIHAVGPRHGQPDGDALLKKAVLSALENARDNGDRSVALPAISSGIFGYPKDLCAHLLIDACAEHMQADAPAPDEVRLCLFDQESCHAFQVEMQRRFSGDPPANAS